MLEWINPELTVPVVLLRLAIGLVIGGAVGLEREYHDQPAGFRTHTLISVGAAVIMLVSIGVPQLYARGDVGDPGRIAAQVVSGIGFLGAGAIIKFGADIRGLTTAASIWAVAALGLAAGAGMYLLTGVATLVMFFTLIVLNRLEKRVFRQRLMKAFVVSVEGADTGVSELRAVIEGEDIRIRTVDASWSPREQRRDVTLFAFVPRHLDIDALSVRLGALPGVTRVSLEEPR
jgi:putative Mg2+ transporter-C (MgtC) family protein